MYQITSSASVTSQFPAHAKFKFPWRKYQERVLSELEDHLSDDHLHIIAPPGSGKTVLGLEVALRLNQPTLILAPTLAIRNQWVQRFCETFLNEEQCPDWISFEIKNPAFLTVATYQGLHAAIKGQTENEQEEPIEVEKADENNTPAASGEIIRLLEQQNLKTLIVDEAHHLKNAWWESLMQVKEALQPTVVGLTATPPYDVSHAEWQRYLELTGPVDAEISVPELVAEGNLCPHQDYIYFSEPTPEERSSIDRYRKQIEDLMEVLMKDEVLTDAIQNHPIYQFPEKHLEWIYSNLESYAASLIFLNAADLQVSKTHLEVIGDKHLRIPELTTDWMETLLGFYLFDKGEHFRKYEEHRQKIMHMLRRKGGLERNTIRLSNTEKIRKRLSSSINKLNSIFDIVNFEYNVLGSELRQVILTDYIRKEYLVNTSENTMDLHKIGVIPIFEKMRRSLSQPIKLGVLTGSLVIIPVSALTAVREEAEKYGITKIETKPLAYDREYVMLSLSDSLKRELVHIITRVFEAGHIQVLIGTKALLGEGWDAPSINSLILASFVGSYVLSNQMRGRAIRSLKDRVKTSNIWHLVCLDPSDNHMGPDMELMERRFRTFLGISRNADDGIENGLGRLGLPVRITSKDQVNTINKQTLDRASNREGLHAQWMKALATGTKLVEEIKIPFPRNQIYREVKNLYYFKTIKYALGALGSALLTFSYEALDFLGRVLRRTNNLESIYMTLTAIGITGFFLFARPTFQAFRMFIKYRDIYKDVDQIAEALLHTLVKTGQITTGRKDLFVYTRLYEDGSIFCHLEGGTTYERSTFIKCLQEILSEVDDPRYLIVRKSMFLDLIAQNDYHAVPEIIGRKKREARYFKDQWRSRVGDCDLVYTRNLTGRKLLLQARLRSLAASFQQQPQRVNVWRQ